MKLIEWKSENVKSIILLPTKRNFTKVVLQSIYVLSTCMSIDAFIYPYTIYIHITENQN